MNATSIIQNNVKCKLKNRRFVRDTLWECLELGFRPEIRQRDCIQKTTAYKTFFLKNEIAIIQNNHHVITKVQ